MRRHRGFVILRLLLIVLVLGIPICLASSISSVEGSEEIADSAVFVDSEQVSSEKPVFQKGMSYTGGGVGGREQGEQPCGMKF